MRPGVIAFALAALALPATTTAQSQPDGQHDFDFEIGRWHVHLERLLKPLTHSTTWVTLDGTSVVRPVWNGLANLGELEVNGPGGHVEGLSFRLYDPRARQWRIHWANSADGVLGSAMVGGFRNGRGEFYDQEDFNGRAIFVRFIFSGITKTTFRIEQAFSDDGGKSWETNWITTFTKDTDQSTPPAAEPAADASHDFDFEVGTWSMRTRQLKEPLGGADWTESSGSTHLAHPVWAGRALLGELQLPGETPTFAGSLLHTYNPQTKQWSVYWADRETGRVSTPMIGEFRNGRGEFYGQQDVRSVTALVRVLYLDVTPTSFRTEQAYSLDGGAHWEPNAVYTFTRRATSAP
jgi:hypothetical protein